MGRVPCRGDHDFAVRRLGIGLARMECRRCDAVIVDLDAAEDGSASITAPGLFGPAKATIFTVLGEERREAERSQEDNTTPRSGPSFAFGESTRRR